MVDAGEPRPVPARPAGEGKPLRLTGNNAGDSLVLEDGSRWEIYPADRVDVAHWPVGDVIELSRAKVPVGDFGWQLTLTAGGKKTLARPI